MWLLFIAAGQRCPAEGFDPEMVELARLNAEIINDIPQAASTGYLRCEHRDKLTPARKGTKFLPKVMLVRQGLKFMSRENSYNLRKNGATMGHGLEPPVFNVFLAKSL
jgi:hypothetical protein